MRLSYRVFLAASLSLGLLGCQGLAPSQLSVPNLTGQQTPSAKGNVSLTIRWPDGDRAGYNVAALPSSTKAFRMTLRKGDQILNEKTLKRSEANWQQDTDGIATSAVSFELASGMGYSLEVSAYNSETALTEGNQVATGISSPFEIQSGHRTSVRISLNVPNGPQVTAMSHAAGGAGSRITLSGSNFGTDLAKIKAFVTVNGSERRAVTVETINGDGTELTALLPTFDYPIEGLAKIRLYVDGISANEQDFRFVRELSVDSSAILSKTEHLSNGPVTTLYAIVGKPFVAPVKGRYWADGQQAEADVQYAVKVLQEGTEVPSAVGSDGNILLPALGAYTLEFTSGTLKQTFTCQAMNLNWLNVAPGTLKVSKLANVTGYQNQAEASLPAQLTGAANTLPVWFRPQDFTWTFSNPSVVTSPNLSNQWYDQQPKIMFESTDFYGETTVTATLKLDPTKSFSFTVMNVGIEGFDFNASKVQLRKDEAVDLHARFKLTDGTFVDPKVKWDIRSKFLWSIDPTSLATVAAKTAPNTYDQTVNGVGVVTAGSQMGTGTITLRWADNMNIQTTIPIEVNDDGRLDLTIE